MSRPPESRFKSNRWLPAGLFAAAALWLFFPQFGQGWRFVGNFDRLNGGSLPLRLFEAREIQAHGSVSNWSDVFFMGTNVGALGGMHTGLSPISWLYAHTPAAWFLPLAATIVAGFWLLAALGAYAALRRLAMRPVAAGAGALAYACSTLITIRMSQGDSLMYNFALFPWLYFLLAGATGPRPARRLALLGGLLFIIFNYSLLQETAYLWATLAVFAATEGWIRKSWRPILFLGIATACAVVATAPRIAEAQHDLRQLQRTPSGRPDEVVTFERNYAQQHLTSREGLRFLADGVFGRYPAEAREIGNNINLNEGFQVYASTFASFLVLGAGFWLWRRPAAPAAGPDPRHLGLAAAIAVGVTGLVLTKTGLYLLYLAFLKIDFSHGRLVAGALFPLAMLVAGSLDRLLPAAVDPESRPSPRGWAGTILAAIVTLAGLQGLTDRNFAPAALAADLPVTSQLRQLWHAGTPRAPTGGMARWVQPGVAALAWDKTDTAIVEVEMQGGDAPFVVMGRNTANRYTIGSIAPNGDYRFRLRCWRGSAASEYSPVFGVAPLPANTTFEQLAPPLVASERTWLLTRALVYTATAALGFSVWLVVFARCRRPATRRWLVRYLALLVMGEALLGLSFRLNGDHTRTFPQPFRQDNLFNSPAGTLNPPTPAARQVLQDRLERDRYRTLLLEPAEQFYSVSLHVPMAWDLRTVQGAWSGVPKRLAALAWPENIVSMRRLIFRPDTDLPWDLLAKLNVKYALTVDTDLYFNRRPAGPDLGALQIVENPRPVVPREFFVTRTVPAERFTPGRETPYELPADPVAESAVEELAAPRDWLATGSIAARYEGDQVTLTFAPAPAPRFLVLNELYHPDWHAVDATGRRLRVHAVNTVMRGVEVPAGATGVQFLFRSPPSRGWWLVALGLGAGGLLAACLWAGRLQPARS